MTARRTRRTVRSAGLVAVAAAAAFSLTACQGGDKDSAADPPKSQAVSESQSAGSGDGDSGSDAKAKGRTEAPAAHPTSTPSTSAKAASSDHTQKLADGSTAKISELGPQRYRAEIIAHGDVLATLETNGHDAGLDANDMFVVLTPDGQVHSWMGGGQTGPGTFELDGGWTAKVTKTGEGRYRAQIIGHDGVAGTLNANQRDAGLAANGVYIVLTAGGEISAHE